jgi:purine-binding chemotaxis protein CheW
MTRTGGPRPPRDWAAVRAAVAAPASGRTAEQARAVMDARARRLAGRPEVAALDQLALAVFELASERYAIELRWVHEVARVADYTPVPGTPEHFVGLTSVRGDVFVVIDLRKLFGLATSGLSDRTRLVLLGDRTPELGVLMDRALGTIALPASHVLPAPPGVAGTAAACVRGVTADATVVLDGSALLMDPRLAIDQTEGMQP